MRISVRCTSLVAAGGALMIGLDSGSAQAFVVDISGTLYDVTTFTGTYNDNISKFSAGPGGVMPWWGDSVLVIDFALAVADNLGLPTPGNLGSAFAIDIVNFGFRPFLQTAAFQPPSFVAAPTPGPDEIATYAQAIPFSPPSAVPGPLPLFGAATAFGMSRRLRRRIKLGA